MRCTTDNLKCYTNIELLIKQITGGEGKTEMKSTPHMDESMSRLRLDAQMCYFADCSIKFLLN